MQFLSVLALTCLLAVNASSQTAPSGTTLPMRSFESRSDLEAEMRLAESQHRTQEAWMLKTRLEKGDFQEGDRIVVLLGGGTKRRQDADFERARVLWAEYRARKKASAGRNPWR